jgi:hypothetical protein
VSYEKDIEGTISIGFKPFDMGSYDLKRWRDMLWTVIHFLPQNKGRNQQK